MFWTENIHRLYVFMYNLSVSVCQWSCMQICSFEPSRTIVLLLNAFFWVHGPSFVCNPMCVGGIVKCKNCISSGKGILPTRIQEGWGRCMKMHVHMLFTSASHPDFPHPNTWNLEWNGLVMGVGSRDWKTGKLTMLSKAKSCQKVIMEDGYLLSMPALYLINNH